MRSKNISFIPVTKRTINCLSSSEFLANQGQIILTHFGSLWHIGHMHRISLSQGTAESDTLAAVRCPCGSVWGYRRCPQGIQDICAELANTTQGGWDTHSLLACQLKAKLKALKHLKEW